MEVAKSKSFSSLKTQTRIFMRVVFFKFYKNSGFRGGYALLLNASNIFVGITNVVRFCVYP